MKQSDATQIILTDLVVWSRRYDVPITMALVEERVSELRGFTYRGTDKHTAAHKCAGARNLHRRANALLRTNI
jgi:hypothetical protein